MKKVENFQKLIFSMMVEYGNFFIALYFRVTFEEKNGPKKIPEMG